MPWLEALLLVLACGAMWLLARRFRTRAYLRVNPRYRQLLDCQGLNSPRAFLSLPAVIISGHPDRNVARVTLGAGANAIHAYLKREHRVRWKQRLANFWRGFGLISVSHREALTLRRLRRAGIGCPEWIADGADGKGRAFLVVEALGGSKDLRRFLADSKGAKSDRRRFARHLAKMLAKLHNAGFSHPDLYAKHILIHPSDGRISFLDWQRSRQHHHVSLEEGWRDLAALDATLTDDLATARERLLCLRAYMSARLAARLQQSAGTVSAFCNAATFTKRAKYRP
jgi:tRNA A-37 threonylcarbamoyl transferase component Bud32